MSNQRTFSQIVQSMTERLRLTQPNLDTKEGTVSKDLFIDIQADEFERLYKSLKLVSDKQSPELAKGKDVERWANNYGISRKSGVISNGIVVFTTNNLNSDIPIPSGTIVNAKNGYQFKTIGNYVMSVSEKNKYAANGNRLRSALNLAGITDSFVIEIPVAATRAGTNGNIAPLQIVNSNLADGLKVTNLTSFRYGNNAESDAAFKSRIFATFSGANTGTAAGYKNSALGTSGVLDATIIKPGSTLMLRDGTETIAVNGGTYRILNSGTGGKVDIYILGKNLEEITESYIYSDLSGVGNAIDERNNFIPGLFGLDYSLTSEERRIRAFEDGQIPLQPIDSIVSVVGSVSGILSEASIDLNGNLVGNYRLLKDTNPDTGGSPFGFDKISFISNTKTVEGESITKTNINSIDPLRFSDINKISKVYQDVQVTSENSSRSLIDKSIITINHTPIVSVSRVSNVSTGEVYTVINQNIDSDSGLNESGNITISGKTLPSKADVLSVDYIWRHTFDGFIDFNGEDTIALFEDLSVNDSINWGVANGIKSESSIITQTEDAFEYTVQTQYKINKVISVFSAETAVGNVELLTNSSGNTVKGVIIPSIEPEIENIISVTDIDKVEVYDTLDGNGTFSGRTIYLPEDTSVQVGSALTILYNKVEFFDIDGGNGSYSNKIITMPSQDILSGADLLDSVSSIFLSESEIFVKYVSEINEIVPTTSITSLPIIGSGTSNVLFNSSLSSISDSNQPVFFVYDDADAVTDLYRFGPSRLRISMDGIISPGRIKISGTTLKRYDLILTKGLSVSGLTFDIKSELKDQLKLTKLPSSIFIARVDSVTGIDSNVEYDLIGQELKNNIYSFGVSSSNELIEATQFILPSTINNSSINMTSGEKIKVSVLIADSSDFELLYFNSSTEIITDKRFARINSVSVSSGFRSTAGNLIGTIGILTANQPNSGLTYSVDYNFKAPTEGERITVKYNLNRLVSTVTSNAEIVRPITADVLVKEAFEIPVDVSGEIVISENATSGSKTILENVKNAVINLLNTSSLNSSVDYSDIITAAASVTGVESVNILQFNESGKQGRKTLLKALSNQSIIAGEVNFVILSRRNFKIT